MQTPFEKNGTGISILIFMFIFIFHKSDSIYSYERLNIMAKYNEETGLKGCTGCKRELKIEMFNNNCCTTDGKDNICRQCRSKVTKAWRAKKKAENISKRGDPQPKFKKKLVLNRKSLVMTKEDEAFLAEFVAEHET